MNSCSHIICCFTICSCSHTTRFQTLSEKSHSLKKLLCSIGAMGYNGGGICSSKLLSTKSKMHPTVENIGLQFCSPCQLTLPDFESSRAPISGQVVPWKSCHHRVTIQQCPLLVTSPASTLLRLSHKVFQESLTETEILSCMYSILQSSHTCTLTYIQKHTLCHIKLVFGHLYRTCLVQLVRRLHSLNLFHSLPCLFSTSLQSILTCFLLLAY